MKKALIFGARIKSASVLTAAVILFAGQAKAQNPNVEAAQLIQSAMDAYSNLNIDSAQSMLEQATQMGYELDKSTLARVYISLGTIYAGGRSDNAQAQRNFIIGLCFDPNAMVDPMLSSPDIDMIFNMSKTQVNPASCQQYTAGILSPSARQPGYPQPQPGYPQPGAFPPPPLPQCGAHEPPVEQKQKYELPIYTELDPAIKANLGKIVAHFAFDASTAFKELELTPKGIGAGNVITCKIGDIQVFDPSTIAYYIEGYDNNGRVICQNGSKETPIMVAMLPDAQPLTDVAGMHAAECKPCPPWDESCQKGGDLPGLGDFCEKDIGCQGDLECSAMGICEMDEGKKTSKEGALSTFYVGLGFGVGFGFVKSEMKDVRSQDENNYLVRENYNIQGMAWSGLPTRLSLGFFVSKRLSIEASFRMDVYITRELKYKSCQEAYVELGNRFPADECEPAMPDNYNTLEEDEQKELREKSIALEAPETPAQNKKTLVPWLINLRGKYKFIDKKDFAISSFLGFGYGHVKYNIKDADGNFHFPMAGMFVIEFGPAFTYYFSKNVGFNIELPLSLLLGDGFGFNVDAVLGLQFGF